MNDDMTRAGKTSKNASSIWFERWERMSDGQKRHEEPVHYEKVMKKVDELERQERAQAKQEKKASRGVRSEESLTKTVARVSALHARGEANDAADGDIGIVVGAGAEGSRRSLRTRSDQPDGLLQAHKGSSPLSSPLSSPPASSPSLVCQADKAEPSADEKSLATLATPTPQPLTGIPPSNVPDIFQIPDSRGYLWWKRRGAGSTFAPMEEIEAYKSHIAHQSAANTAINATATKSPMRKRSS
jgi:hypothetical protein